MKMLMKFKSNAVNEKEVEKKPFIPLIGEPVKIATTEKYAGKFALLNYSTNNTSAHIPSWVACREVFGGHFTKKTENFAFSHKPKCGINIAAFFARFEDQLKLKKNRTLFTLTDKNNIIIVIPSLWWRKYLVRRSLFTILLRAAQAYVIERDNFEDALFSDPYAKETKIALRAFLKGQTFAKKKMLLYSGWKATFANKREPEVLNILQKPPKKLESTINPDTVEAAIDKQFTNEEIKEAEKKIEFPDDLTRKAKVVFES
jgi:hypothetical protein